MQFSALSFDALVSEFAMALSAGASLVLPRAEDRLGEGLIEFLARQRITHVTLPPAVLSTLDPTRTPALDCLIVAGESLLESLARVWVTEKKVINAYGPTETTVCVTMSEPLVAGETPSIGRPISNTQIYLLDDRMNPVPIGVAGELYIGGAGLARGYLGRPDLTAERFVPNPFGEAGTRLYRSGDLARHREDGDIEFLGRIDAQVKIRGFRIEPGEIEAALARLPDIREAVVIAREDASGDKRLLAYVVARDGAEPSAATLRETLGRELPDYMIPSAFVVLEALPLTANGKIDRKALPSPDLGAKTQGYVAPRDALEETLCRIFAEVLGLERIGVNDNFFECGGHSLLAVQAMARIRRDLDREPPLRALFAAPTVAQFARTLAGAAADASDAPPEISRASRANPLPLSFAQQRLWFLDQLTPGDVTYNIPAALRLVGEFDRDAARAALTEIVRRHEVLRTRFITEHGEARQEIAPPAPIAATPVDLSELNAVERELEARRLVEDEITRPFELDRGPLLRVLFIDLGRRAPTGEREHVVAFTLHHIVSDGWSTDIFVREFVALYEAFIAGAPSPLPEPSLQYADYAVWQRGWLQGATLDEQLDYWRKQLSDAPPLLELPFDHPRPAVQDHAGAIYSFTVSKQVWDRLRRLGQSENATPFMTLLAAFQLLLARYSGQQDICVGTPIANRRRVELEGLIGFFVNTLALRTDLSGDPSFCVLLARVRETALGAQAHQDLPFERLVEELQPARDMSRSPLFQVMFVLQNAPGGDLALPGLRLEAFGMESASAKFDLTLSISEGEAGLFASLEYATALFEAATIARLAEHFCLLLESIAQAPQRRISAFELLSAAERRRLLIEWNATAADYGRDRLLHELFEEQAAAAPQAMAVVFEETRLGYGELNARANQLARHLRGLGVGPDVLVGVAIERSPDMLVALLGALKAGGAYLPLDPAYPRERLAFMIEDAAPLLVLTTQALRQRLPETTQTLRLDADWASIAEQAQDNLPARAQPQNLAYVIYTSGSTGRPKGAGVSHRNVRRLFAATHAEFSFSATDVWTLFHSFAFDFSVWEIWGALLYGGRLVVVPYWVSRSPEAFHELLAAQGVTVLNQTPSSFYQLDAIDAAQGAARALSLRLVIFGGEALEPQRLAAWFERHGDAQPALINMYGITETTVHVTLRALQRGDAARRDSCIGRPLNDLQAFLLDAQMNPVPLGVAGELYVGGGGLARGYLGRPDLTAQRFVPNPFDEAGTRLYRTGDLARFREDGNIDYLGRIDSQVKIRGFRIELGEIEAALARLPDVRETAVLAREDSPGDRRLVAYVVLREGGEPNPAALRETLGRDLPDYMVPSAFVALDALPLTPNGKLDRKALPSPDIGAQAAQRYVAPRNAAEETLCRIFAEALKLDRVGIQDNFFELGGHSLLAVQLVERLRGHGLRANVRALFAHPTPAGLTAAINVDAEIVVPPNLIPDGCDAITPQMLPLVKLSQGEIDSIVNEVAGGAANVQDIYPLAPLQEGILFHHLMATEGDAYLLQTLLAFVQRERFDDFTRALQAAIARHDILRTAIIWEGLQEPVQVVWREAPLIIEELRLDPAAGDIGEELRARFDPRRYRLDIRRAPMLRLYYAHDAAQDRWVAQLLHHHLIDDNTTLRFAIEDMEAHLLGRSGDLASPPPFRNFVAQARLGASRAEHEAFFRDMLGDVDEPTTPFGLRDAQGDGSEIAEARLDLDAELARRLRARARALGVSAASLFHQAFAYVLALASGRSDVVFGTVLFGRMQGGAGADRALGMFINTLPLRARIGDESVSDGIRTMQRALTALLQHERASLALAQRASLVAAPTPLFSALLNYRHSPAPAEARDQSESGWGGVETLYSEERTNYPFVLSADDFGEGFALTAQTRAPIDPARVCGFMRLALERLVEALETAPQTPARLIDVLPHDERRRLLVEWNATQADYPQDRLLHELFEGQAQRTPQAVAVVFEETQLSYGELNAKANQLARHLRAHGRRAGCRGRRLRRALAGDGRCALRRIEGRRRLSAARSRLSARTSRLYDRRRRAAADPHASGLARTPAAVRPNASPRRRLAVDRRAGAGQSRRARAAAKSRLCDLHVRLDRQAQGRWRQPWRRRQPPRLDAEALRPRRLRCSAAEDAFRLRRLGVGVLLAAYGRRASGCGASAGSSRTGAARKAHRSRGRHHAALRAVDAAGVSGRRRRGVAQRPAPRAVQRRSAVRKPQAAVLRQAACELHNLYGPTEASIDVTAHACAQGDRETLVAIGRPISNTQIYLLDDRMNPVPIGVAGELYIGGAGLARGYLGRPDLTAERFVPNPFGEAGTRLYRTGDLARHREDGDIEFLGRIDDQVKIRGFRIEPGEIEAALARLPDIREAVVIAREDASGDKRLLAYVVARDGAEPSAAALRETLGRELPDYMIPSAFVVLEALPLTANGKIDRKALPSPDLGAKTQGYVAPRDALEETLCRIFAEVLGLERIGVNDNFFECGGHSLLAVQAMARIRRDLDREPPLRALFAAPTVAQFARTLAGAAADASDAPPEISRASRANPLPLSFAQQRLWFLDQLTPGDVTYNIPAALRLVGEFDRDAARAALTEIVRRHEVLRTRFITEHGEARQEIAPPAPIAATPVDLSELNAVERELEARRLVEDEITRPFELDRGPLLRVLFIDLGRRAPTGEREHVVAFTLHHIVSDGWSTDIFVREFVALYEAFIAGAPSPLPEPSLQYADYAVWQRGWLQGATLDEQLDYWRKQLSDAPPLLELPFDHPRPAVQDHAGAIYSFTVSKQVWDRLRRLGQSENATPFMTLLAAFQLLLARYSGQQDICVGTPIANRRRVELEGLIGFFVNTLALRTDLSGDPSFCVLLARVRETALGAQAHQDLPFERLVEELQPARDMSRSPLFQVMFVLQNAPGGDLALPGLRLEAFGMESASAKFDLTLSISEGEAGLFASLEYATALFEAATIARLAEHFCLLLESIAQAPQRRISAFELLSAAERRRLLIEWNATAADYGRDRLLHELFEEQAAARRKPWPWCSKRRGWAMANSTRAQTSSRTICAAWASGRMFWSASASNARSRCSSRCSACSRPAAPICRSIPPIRGSVSLL